MAPLPGIQIELIAERLERLECFSRHVAHDLRAPLVSMAGLAQRAQSSIDDGDLATARTMMHLLRGRAEDLGLLVRQLLALAEADEVSLQRGTVDLHAIADRAIEEARLALPPGEDIEIRLHPLPEVTGSPALLKQVFVNLVGNAVKFSRGTPEPVVEVGVSGGDVPGVLYVRDNGVGFDATRAGELFKPFARLHGGRYAGHGLGLSLVRRVVERHGGRVWAAPNAPRGAAFFFTLGGLDGLGPA